MCLLHKLIIILIYSFVLLLETSSNYIYKLQFRLYDERQSKPFFFYLMRCELCYESRKGPFIIQNSKLKILSSYSELKIKKRNTFLPNYEIFAVEFPKLHVVS